MSNRNYTNVGDYKLIVDGGKVVVQGEVSGTTPIEINQRDNTPASIGFTFQSDSPGYIGVNDGELRFGNDANISNEVFHEGRLPRLLDEIDLTGADDILGDTVSNVLYVSEDGSDTNTGQSLRSSKLTIKSALAKANELQQAALDASQPRPPITIFVKSGRYVEDNPLIVNRNVTIWGDNLRSTFVSPLNKPFLTEANFTELELIDPDPLTANPGSYTAAASALLSAKATLQADVVTYVNTLPGPPVSDKCSRDVGFIVDAIAEDLVEGGNTNTEKAALAYFRQGDVVLDVDKVTQIVAALTYLADEIESALSAFTGSGKEVAKALALAVKDTIDDPIDFVKRATVTVTISGGTITGVTIVDGGFGYRGSTLTAVDILKDTSGVTTPATIEFGIVSNVLTTATIDTGGVGLPNGTVDISLELPHPDDAYDLFYVNNGAYLSGMTFNGLRGKASAVAFDPLRTDPGTASESKGFITTSPYVQNCSCINTNEEGGIGMKIDGKRVSGLRSMVSDAFTQINTAGTGVYLLNRGYAQLVSIFTVSTHIGILAESGGFCSVANSNSSFGNFGLVSRGVSELLDSGTIDGGGSPVPTFSTEFTVDSLTRRPAFGDAVLFNYTYSGTVSGDSVSFSGFDITSADDTRIEIYNDGTLLKTYQYAITDRAPLSVTLTETQLIAAQDETDYAGAFDGGTGYVNGDVITLNNGDIVTVDLVSSGVVTEFTITTVNGVAFDGVTLTQDSTDGIGTGFEITPDSDNLEAVITLGTVTSRLKKYYTVDNSTDVDSGTATITLDLGVTQAIPDGTTIEFYQRSLITSSAHTFEYIGSGTNFLSAIPGAGGIPIRENEIVQDSDLGGQVFFTSTDEKGDFKIGPELTINRNTGTITGEAFDRSLFAVLTPYILSLES